MRKYRTISDREPRFETARRPVPWGGADPTIPARSIPRIAMARFRPARSLVVVALLLAPSASRADEPARTHDITIDDYFSLSAVSEVATSPDGTYVAYTEIRWQAETNDRRADLWVVEADSGRATR